MSKKKQNNDSLKKTYEEAWNALSQQEDGLSKSYQKVFEKIRDEYFGDCVCRLDSISMDSNGIGKAEVSLMQDRHLTAAPYPYDDITASTPVRTISGLNSDTLSRLIVGDTYIAGDTCVTSDMYSRDAFNYKILFDKLVNLELLMNCTDVKEYNDHIYQEAKCIEEIEIRVLRKYEFEDIKENLLKTRSDYVEASELVEV